MATAKTTARKTNSRVKEVTQGKAVTISDEQLDQIINRIGNLFAYVFLAGMVAGILYARLTD